MNIYFKPDGGLAITAAPHDGYRFATRPGQFWPGSTIRNLDTLTIELDEGGDLIDLLMEPEEEVPSYELSAFIDYALERAALTIARHQAEQKARLSGSRYGQEFGVEA